MPRLVTTAIIFAALAAIAFTGLLFGVLGEWTEAGDSGLFKIGALCAVGLALLFTLLWLFLHGKVFRPLVSILEDSDIAVQRGGEAEAPPSNLNPLAGGMFGLARQLGAARRDARGAADRGRAQRRRLESILQDLSEGVIICNLEHQVLLYNRVALWLLSGAGEIGIGRPLPGLIDAEPVEEALGKLTEAAPAGPPDRRETVSLLCRVPPTGSSLAARMTLTFDGKNRPDGYVLTLSGDNAGPVADVPPAGREFYDFDLFHRPLAAGWSAAGRLWDHSYVVFDTETTGLRPTEGDRIVAIAGVRAVNGRVLRAEIFDSLVNPGRPIPPPATRVHGITDAMVADAPGIEDALPRFRRFAGDAALVAHNAPFDLKFLEMAKGGGALEAGKPVLDTRLLSLAVYGDADGHGLEAVASRLGVAIPPGERHTALGDALAAAEVFVRLLGILEARGVRTLGELLELSEKQARGGRMRF